VPDPLLGTLGAGMVMVALVVLIRGGERDGAAPALAAPPTIELLKPASGAILTEPLAVDFRVDGDLIQQPSGWGVAGQHVHLQLDGLELMPSAADIEQRPSGSYRWRVGRLEAGPHRLRLFWSDAQHRPVEAGGSAPVEIEAR
jgi:hypothetical protein